MNRDEPDQDRRARDAEEMRRDFMNAGLANTNTKVKPSKLAAINSSFEFLAEQIEQIKLLIHDLDGDPPDEKVADMSMPFRSTTAMMENLPDLLQSAGNQIANINAQLREKLL